MAPSPGETRFQAFLGLLLSGWALVQDGGLWDDVGSFTVADLPLPLNRHQRRQVTRYLNAQTSSQPDEPVGCAFQWLQCARPQVRWRRKRGHLFKQRANWRYASKPLRLWSGWPLRGRRIGEAANPGPEPGTPLGSERPARERSPPRACSCSRFCLCRGGPRWASGSGVLPRAWVPLCRPCACQRLGQRQQHAEPC